MALLGFLILVGVVLVITAVVFRGGDSVRIDLEWFTINADAWAVFAAGAITLVLLLIGLWLLRSGLKRSRRRRAEMRTLRERADANDAARQRAQPTEATNRPTTTDGPDDHFDSTPRES